MRVPLVFAFVAALAYGSAAQAVDFTLPDLDGTIDYAAVYNLDLMYADLEVMDTDRLKGAGRVTHYIWTENDGIERQAYRTVVRVSVPSKVPGFETLKAALSADVRIDLYSQGVRYAQCLLAVQPVTSDWIVTYELLLAGAGDDIKPIKGVCDIDVNLRGIQAGIPQMQFEDLITNFIRYDARPDFRLMEGYCY